MKGDNEGSRGGGEGVNVAPVCYMRPVVFTRTQVETDREKEIMSARERGRGKERGREFLSAPGRKF